MKAVLLAGGLGTRLREETEYKPKPMVAIDGRPIIWHIMKNLSKQGINEFIICLGYKGDMIRDYFINYEYMNDDIQVNLQNSSITFPQKKNRSEDWKVTLVDTGEITLTSERIMRVKQYVKGETFLCTYGDGLADINLNHLVDFHDQGASAVTLTAVRPISRFGTIELLENGQVESFAEKPLHEGWINGGFFIMSPRVFDYLEVGMMLEGRPMENLARDGQLRAYKHNGFWQPMDTYREAQILNSLWTNQQAPWKNW
jgi:glucose-1-phosphate cytidylyltransferase